MSNTIRKSLRLILALILVMLLPNLAASELSNDQNSIELFEKEIRPLFSDHCMSCHGQVRQLASLRLDSREALLEGGNRGPAIIPGDASLSLLAKAVRHDGLKMPLGGEKLTVQEIASIEKWINLGAVWPVYDSEPSIVSNNSIFYERIVKNHWAFQPLFNAESEKWKTLDHPVDQFVLTVLRKMRLKPAKPSSRKELIRRLSFVLTGLPPTPLEVDLFVRDVSPGAYARLVDRLMSSPHFGEHWARHWMDVMRFAETFGRDWNFEIKGAWLYRDYLIRAFNQDVPYDQLIREHIAGDLLKNPRINVQEKINESSIGTSFLRFGELGHDDCIRFREIRTDVVDNQIDTLGKAFQGLTIACARCHDHKLDPIPTSDYYALYGALTSSRMVMSSPESLDVNVDAKELLRNLKPLIRAELAKQWTQESILIPRYLLAADRVWKGFPPRPQDLTDLSFNRIQAWLTLLEKEKPEMEDLLYPWIQVAGQQITQEWDKLRSHYVEETQYRVVFNQKNFRSFGDFTQDGFGGWHSDGSALVDGPSVAGEFAIGSSGPVAVTSVFPAGIYTHALSERLNAALRSPLVPKDKKFVSLQVMGGKLSSWRTILDNCMLSNAYQLLAQDSLHWVKIPNRDDQSSLPFYIELVTTTYNPRIPDRLESMKITPEQIIAPNSYFGIRRAVLHDIDESPQDELSHMARLFEINSPNNLEDLAEGYAAVIGNALGRWVTGKSSDDDGRWIGWFLENQLFTNTIDQTPELQALIREYRLAESRIASPKAFNGMADLDPGYNVPILLAGDAENPGEVVPRGFLQLITGTPDGLQVFGSGRQEIAELIASSTNPLTARVMANRIWLHVFGDGIVSTPDNFGVYGEGPSHPELLDYLASRFIREGWSIKKLIRFLVLSQTFQQSSGPSSESLIIDPLNRLLSHYPVRRLEGESIRDAILAVSGRLNRTMYGPSIQPHREEPKDYRGLHQGPLDGDGRRSVYLKVTRHEGSRFLETFDFPSPTITRGKRNSTNVPSQALVLLNGPFVIEQAGFWADGLIRILEPTVDSRLDSMFRTALGRLPNHGERDQFKKLVEQLVDLHKIGSEQILENREVWKDVAHVILNLKEFIYFR